MLSEILKHFLTYGTWAKGSNEFCWWTFVRGGVVITCRV